MPPGEPFTDMNYGKFASSKDPKFGIDQDEMGSDSDDELVVELEMPSLAG